MRWLSFMVILIFSLTVNAVGPVNTVGPVGVDENGHVDPVTGIRLPDGFKATVFVDHIGRIRHIYAHEDWLYGALQRPVDGKGGIALRDTDGDGHADEKLYFADGLAGTGIHVQGGFLYYGTRTEIYRIQLDGDGRPTDMIDVVMEGFPLQRAHASKSLTMDPDGFIYVNVGVPSNACMKRIRTKGSPGQMPCPELELHGSIWRLDSRRTGQQFPDDAEKYSTGHRNAMALDWDIRSRSLYLVQHGRDQLSQLFPEFFSDGDNAELPAEEFHKVAKGADLGWPYSYFDQRRGARMVMPEYGGDGKTVSSIGQKPLIGFPGHWAPNDMIFVKGDGLPAAYKGGALIAFHGSWNRAPLPQEGYRLVFVPMTADGAVDGDGVTFADGFSGGLTGDKIMSPGDAVHRPTGLAESPDGAIFVSSGMSGGRIWRISYEGDDS